MKLPALLFCSLFGLLHTTANAAEATIAVAANFTGPMEKIAPAFEKTTGHKLDHRIRNSREVLRPDQEWRTVRCPCICGR